MPWLGDRILPIILEISQRWGELAAILRAKGKPKSVIDSLIAATALEHDLILVTRNVTDYSDMELTILNPWQAE